jgi:hypothetical protein
MTLACTMIGAGGAGAEIFKKEDLLRGTTISHAQCDATPLTFWLNVHGHDFCVRYYLSTAGGEGQRPVVILQGDQLGKFNLKTMTWTDTSEAKDVDTADIIREADGFSKMARTTVIHLGRIGVDGTSGNHMSRKTVLELDLMNAALDALKTRYGYEGFHLAGQSGGSKVLAGLIEERHDIACAVMGSGPLMLPDSPKSPDPGRSFFELSPAKIAQSKLLRPIVVSDKTDKRVPVAQQTSYVERLRKAGRQIPQFFVDAPWTADNIADDLHHGVMDYTRLALAGCVLGRSDDEIGRAISTMVTRSADYNEVRQREAKSKPAILTAAKEATPSATPPATEPAKK